MEKLLSTLLGCILAAPSFAYAQTPKPDASKVQSHPCVIVRPNVQTPRHNHAFDYVEGDYPSGFKWRSELRENDVRELKQKGGKVVVLRIDYSVWDLQDARKQCQSQTVK